MGKLIETNPRKHPEHSYDSTTSRKESSSVRERRHKGNPYPWHVFKTDNHRRHLSDGQCGRTAADMVSGVAIGNLKEAGLNNKLVKRRKKKQKRSKLKQRNCSDKLLGKQNTLCRKGLCED